VSLIASIIDIIKEYNVNKSDIDKNKGTAIVKNNDIPNPQNPKPRYSK
jgi:hypothetical protein